MSETRLSFVIPARNEEALIGEVLEAILASVARASGLHRKDLWLPDTSFEVIVADDGSEDDTAAIVRAFADDVGVRLLACVAGTGAAARNAGAAASSGRVLCFVDADTIVPENAVDRILELHEGEGSCLVLYRLVSREPGIRAWLWWTFWALARRLPLARAKSMPAFMSCDRAHFESYGPFEASWLIAEEWPLTAAAYRYHRERFLYDRSLTARTSSRRMELQPFGYLRTFLKWVSAVLVASARTDAYDRIRHERYSMMPGKTMVLILGAVAFSAVGQLLLKSGAQHLAGLGRLEFLLAAARNMQVLTGLAAWMASTLCWLYVLRVAPLSRVYGLTSLTYVLIPLASIYVFGEQIRRMHVVGIVLIIMGIACVLSGD